MQDICYSCSGSGRDGWDGGTCPRCGGSGARGFYFDEPSKPRPVFEVVIEEGFSKGTPRPDLTQRITSCWYEGQAYKLALENAEKLGFEYPQVKSINGVEQTSFRYIKEEEHA